MRLRICLLRHLRSSLKRGFISRFVLTNYAQIELRWMDLASKDERDRTRSISAQNIDSSLPLPPIFNFPSLSLAPRHFLAPNQETVNSQDFGPRRGYFSRLLLMMLMAKRQLFYPSSSRFFSCFSFFRKLFSISGKGTNPDFEFPHLKKMVCAKDRGLATPFTPE